MPELLLNQLEKEIVALIEPTLKTLNCKVHRHPDDYEKSGEVVKKRVANVRFVEAQTGDTGSQRSLTSLSQKITYTYSIEILGVGVREASQDKAYQISQAVVNGLVGERLDSAQSFISLASVSINLVGNDSSCWKITVNINFDRYSSECLRKRFSGNSAR